MKKRRLIIIFLLGYLTHAIAGYVFPPLTVGFWRLACTQEVAFSAVGMGGDLSDQYLICSRIDQSLTPEASYRLLFFVGTPAAKCHALVGLRQFDQKKFGEYATRLEASDRFVMNVWMDFGSEEPVSRVAASVRRQEEGVLNLYQKEYREWSNQRREAEYLESEKRKTEANQPLEPTPTAVTSASGAAHH
jgi:hypothetical protein